MNFGFLLFNGLEELDLVGPWEMISVWSKFFHGPGQRMLIAEKPEPVTCAKGMILQPHISFEECPPLDFLLVPGGEGTRTEVDNPELISFVSTQAESCQALLCVCTGSFILHRAGLLNGRRATTHWMSLDRLRALGDVEVVEERIVHDGRIWSSAGVSAGIDLALAFIEHIAGEETAGKVQLGAEYYPSTRRYGESHSHEKAPQYLKDR